MSTRYEFKLTSKHIEAVNRQRRIIFHYDAGAFFVHRMRPEQQEGVIAYIMSIVDEEPNQIDSVWYDMGSGDRTSYQSELLPPMDPTFQKWWKAGIDPLQLFLDETRKRGREVFFTFRINVHYSLESSTEHGYSMPAVKSKHPDLVKTNHPDWLIQWVAPYWNFAVKQVRDLKVRILRELAEKYEFDGIQIDFARNPILFPAGQQWKNRDLLTDFVRQVRLALLEVEKKRKRPLLLAVRVPENIMGCHFDGMDVETWAQEKLVDIFVLGSRSSDIDIPAFRQITAGAGIKLYPCWTDEPSSDGYLYAPIEVYRGVYANWWRQGADGAYSFNFYSPNPKTVGNLGLSSYWSWSRRWEVQRMVFREIGSLETLKYKDKVFFVQRRGGGHSTMVPNTYDWHTPRHMYFLTNMFAPLPTALANDGKVDTLLTLKITDDVNAAADRIKEITLRLAITDPAAKHLPGADRLERPKEDLPSSFGIQDMPPAKGIETKIEVRINNLLLGPAHVERGWLVFPAKAQQLAVGDNLVGVRVTERPSDVQEETVIEKLELHIKYR